MPVTFSAKHELKSNAVDQLLNPSYDDSVWMSNERTVRVLPTPGKFTDTN